MLFSEYMHSSRPRALFKAIEIYIPLQVMTLSSEDFKNIFIVAMFKVCKETKNLESDLIYAYLQTSVFGFKKPVEDQL